MGGPKSSFCLFAGAILLSEKVAERPPNQAIREVLPELGFALVRPNACRDRRLQFDFCQTVLVVEARNRKCKLSLA